MSTVGRHFSIPLTHTVRRDGKNKYQKKSFCSRQAKVKLPALSRRVHEKFIPRTKQGARKNNNLNKYQAEPIRDVTKAPSDACLCVLMA